ncbi:serine/threonine protein kinase [Rubritalea marina]|uniref:serine/threonine protein kinase n=1 Tax=Rubritalea marina TaxID=361055 RepID=UPI00037B8AE1|nr:protein kinase [Rubritalea marina]
MSKQVQNYRIREKLGEGRAGAVYAADSLTTGDPVAFRRFAVVENPEEETSWEKDFHDVISDLKRIEHPNILKVLDAGVDEDGPYMVTEHLEGLSLSQVMRQEGHVSLSAAYLMVQQCLSALSVAEEYGYFHHALSPSSVMAAPHEDGSYTYTLVDLGHSKLIPLLSSQGVGALSKVMDPALLAPEIYVGQPEGVRSTLYMFGQLVYWVLAGGHPLAGLDLAMAHAKHNAGEIPDLRSYRPDIPDAFRLWLMRLIEPNPMARPDSVQSALASLPAFEVATSAPSMPQPIRMDAAAMQPNYEGE